LAHQVHRAEGARTVAHINRRRFRAIRVEGDAPSHQSHHKCWLVGNHARSFREISGPFSPCQTPALGAVALIASLTVQHSSLTYSLQERDAQEFSSPHGAFACPAMCAIAQ